MAEKTIFIKEIGKIVLKQSAGMKRMSIKIKINFFDGICVTFPPFVSFEEAEKLVLEKENWIKKHITEINSIENKYTIFDENTVFKTKFHTLKIKSWAKNSVYVMLENEFIYIYYPSNKSIQDKDIQKVIRDGIEYALRIEAKDYLPKRTKQLALKHNFEINKIFIKNAKTRWGSCSNINNINLNLHLMRLPDHLIDYVILHELAHTVEKNHAKGFWALLDKLSGNAKLLDKELNNYNIKIY